MTFRAITAIAVGLVLGVSIAYQVSLVPPRLSPRQLSFYEVRGRLLVDTPYSTLPNVESPTAALTVEARLLSQIASSPAVASDLAERAGARPAQLLVASGPNRIEQVRARVVREPVADERAYAVVRENSIYQVHYQVQFGVPIIDLSSAGSTSRG